MDPDDQLHNCTHCVPVIAETSHHKNKNIRNWSASGLVARPKTFERFSLLFVNFSEDEHYISGDQKIQNDQDDNCFRDNEKTKKEHEVCTTSVSYDGRIDFV